MKCNCCKKNNKIERKDLNLCGTCARTLRYIKNPETHKKVLVQKKEYYQRNIEKERQRSQNWRKNNPEKRRIQRRNWLWYNYEETREQRNNANREWHHNHKEKLNAQRRIRFQLARENPNWELVNRDRIIVQAYSD